MRGSELLKEGDGADRWGRVVSDRRERRGWQAVRWAVLGRGKKQAERELGRAGGKRRGRPASRLGPKKKKRAVWAEKKEGGEKVQGGFMNFCKRKSHIKQKPCKPKLMLKHLTLTLFW